MHTDYTQPTNLSEAKQQQQTLRERVTTTPYDGDLRYVGGIDVGYNKQLGMAQASLVVMDWEELEVVSEYTARLPVDFPYVSGYLSFREIPAVLAVLKQCNPLPDLLMLDGQGVAHPRRLGIASHLGVLLDMPTIGVAKSRLCGHYPKLNDDKGAKVKLTEGDELLGYVLRSRANVNPLFISPGHKVGFEQAVGLVEYCLTKYRLPEPTRLADKLSKWSCAPAAVA
ncbi:MAG: deoxyribonuclease V [Rickettsiales bacterium]|nr:deoxyribonuclease V [Rickettsiales bacterium]